jgi:hypothetical protein
MAGLDKYSQEFVANAKSGDYAAALKVARNFTGTEQATTAMEALSPDQLDSLISACQLGLDAQAKFVALIVRDVAMPELKDCPMLVNYVDFTEARKYILKKLDNPKTPKKLKVPYPQRAYERSFYPEYNTISDRRDRTVALARLDASLKPEADEHRNLFSMGGCFTWNGTGSWVNPSGTTCGIFVRSALFAAGCRADKAKKYHKMAYSLVNYMGIGDAGHGHKAFVKYKEGLKPKPGDVFHIGGGTFKSGEHQGAANDHVGMVVEVIDDKNWKTVEGGQDYNHTYAKQRKVINRDGQFGFEDDSMKRTLFGWVDIDKFDWAW